MLHILTPKISPKPFVIYGYIVNDNMVITDACVTLCCSTHLTASPVQATASPVCIAITNVHPDRYRIRCCSMSLQSGS